MSDETLCGEFYQLPKAVCGFAMEAVGRGEVDVVAAKAEPVDEAAGHTAVLGEFVEFVDHLSIEESEVSGFGDDGGLANAVDDFVVEDGAESFEEGVSGGVVAHAYYHVTARLPLFDKLWDECGWVLQVGVHGHHGVAVGEAVACGGGGFFAEVAREIDDFHVALVLFFQCFGNPEGVVGTAVIHDEHFVGHGKWGTYLGEFCEEEGEILGLIKGGYDDTEEGFLFTVVVEGFGHDVWWGVFF